MFSSLGPLFKTVFRTAEETDTRQAIRREEKEQGRQRKDAEDDHRISIDLWEDKSSVSVDALQSFLIAFIKGETFAVSGKNSANNLSTNTTQATSDKPTEKKQAKTTVAARAAYAYEAMNEKTAPIQHETLSDQTLSDADLIQSKEARHIHKLIENLEFLKSKGVQEIFIEPADSFVESLEIAINAQKKHLKA